MRDTRDSLKVIGLVGLGVMTRLCSRSERWTTAFCFRLWFWLIDLCLLCWLDVYQNMHIAIHSTWTSFEINSAELVIAYHQNRTLRNPMLVVGAIVALDFQSNPSSVTCRRRLLVDVMAIEDTRAA